MHSQLYFVLVVSFLVLVFSSHVFTGMWFWYTLTFVLLQTLNGYCSSS